MSSCKKRVGLTTKEKVEIIAQLEKGEAPRALAEKCGIGISIILCIKKKCGLYHQVYIIFTIKKFFNTENNGKT